jgi:hypothetical protein
MEPIDVLAFSHIGFVVPSIARFRSSWGALLGIEDWLIREPALPPGGVQIHGDLIEEPSKARVAFAKFRGTALELIEPLEGPSPAATWLAAGAGGIQHIGVWVNDLARQLTRLREDIAVTYSAAALHPVLASRPVSATLSGVGETETLPFWAYVEPFTTDVRWSLELLDAQFAADFRAYYGDRPFYPGELPGTAA